MRSFLFEADGGDGKEVIQDIIDDGKFHPWPDTILQIPWRTAGGDGQDLNNPGEDRVAALVGGERQGSASTFDVLGPDNKKWEVKYPVGAKIRTGVEGTSASSKFRSQVKSVSQSLAELNESEFVQEADAELAKNLNEFVSADQNGLKSILKDEISLRAFDRVMDILKRLSVLERKQGEATVEISTNEKSAVGIVSRQDALRIAKLAGLKPDEIGVSSLEGALSVIDVSVLSDPEKWKQDIVDSVKASKVFAEMTGVVLVSQGGYVVVGQDQLDSAFTFNGITQARIKYNVSSGLLSAGLFPQKEKKNP